MIRLFLVGCSRSGTSIVQRELYQKLGLFSLPETRYFRITAGKPNYWTRLFAVKHLLVAAGQMEEPTQPKLIKYAKVFRVAVKLLGWRRALAIYSGCVPVRDPFLWTMDIITEQAGCGGWVEKTPMHFWDVETLLEAADNTRVLFLVRNGVDVVASIRDRAEKHKLKMFSGQDDPAYAINLWNESLAAAMATIDHPRVGVIMYEDFCQAPEEHISKLASFVSDEPVTAPTQSVEFAIRTEREAWKEGLSEGIAVSPSKAPQYFSAEQIAQIESELDLASYAALRQSAAQFIRPTSSPPPSDNPA